MLARVSHIEAFRRWQNFVPLHDNDVEPTLEEFVASLTNNEPTEPMLAGTAFHKAIEMADFGEHYELSANGYTFMMRGGEVELPQIREMRGYRRYGELEVTGQVDGIHGLMVIDHKTTSKFDAERFLAGAQWKFYLDIFGANVFRWLVYEIKEMGERTYDVMPPQPLTAYRYPELGADCSKLAGEYLAFARLHLPEHFVRAAA